MLISVPFLWLLLRNNPDFDEYVDGIVYAVCVGMGFAAFENIGYLFGNIDTWVSVGFVRAISAIPGHFFFAVMMGYFYSKAAFGNPSRRGLNFALAILVPVLLHGAYDSILMVSTVVASMAGALFVLFLGLYVFMAVLTKRSFGRHLLADEAAYKERMDAEG